MQSRIKRTNILKSSNFLNERSSVRESGIAIMDGSSVVLELMINGKYHLVTHDNLFKYFPEYGSIKRWFDGRFED